MTRVAEAYRKARALHSGEWNGGQSQAGSGQTGPDFEVPWDFDSPSPAKREESEPVTSRLMGVADPEPAARPAPEAAPPAAALARPAPAMVLPAAVNDLAALAHRLFRPGEPERPLRSLLFSAVGAGTGSADVCGATADALARQTTGLVCIVDANLRTPGLEATLGTTTGGRGLSNALLETCKVETCLIRMRENFWLLGAGSRCAEALPLLTADRFRQRLTELLVKFDYVIVDGPAAGAHSDVLTLGPVVGGVVLVVDANATRRESAKRTAGILRAANVSLLGSVMTNRTFPIPQSIYRRL